MPDNELNGLQRYLKKYTDSEERWHQADADARIDANDERSRTQDTALAVLANEFKNHKENEERWQEGISEDIGEIKNMLQKIIPQIQENTIVLHGPGPEKKNGLRGEMKKVNERLDKQDGYWKTLIAIFVAVQILWNVGSLAVKAILTEHDTKRDTVEQVK